MPEILPTGWVKTTLGEVCSINSRTEIPNVPDDTLVSFVPMSAVEEETGRLDPSDVRSVGSVRKGYTPFRENDVLFAKITPCMENGKVALATGLNNALGYGSTEFFVFRPREGVLPRFILYFLLQPSFRKDAERQMTGAVGQKRVPLNYLAGYEFLLPPTPEQARIIETLDKTFSGLERGEKAARRGLNRLQEYRQAVLRSAMIGAFASDFAESGSDTGEELLKKLLDERKHRWEDSQRGRREKSRKSANDKSKSHYPACDFSRTMDHLGA
jgi:type I restriction enzyme, S subunit